jgi:predicted alpha/beta superfamily hydrolase
VKQLASLFAFGSLLPLLAACAPSSNESGSGGSTSSSSTSATASGVGGASSSSTSTSTSTSTSGAGGAAPALLDTILGELRVDAPGTLAKYANENGWPMQVEGGVLFVSTDLKLGFVAGEHDQWAGTPMQPDQGFLWVVLPVLDGDQYKFTDKITFVADPFARSFTYDTFGEISLVKPKTAHIERWVGIGDAALKPRTVRVWVPTDPVTHELYMADGQNLWDPKAPFGYWKLQETTPPGLLVVGIDNTPARLDEYTHIKDLITEVSATEQIGGLGDAYADFLKNTVRPLIRKHYGEPGPVGLMGSSLGGLISLHIADRDPGAYAFAGSLSGTLGWGSIGAGIHNPTMIERYKAHGHQSTVLYLDSGGVEVPCADTDGDGIHDDDLNGKDNYCENVQMRDTLLSSGYMADKDFFYHWEPGAVHNEAAWSKRVFRPFGIFMGL